MHKLYPIWLRYKNITILSYATCTYDKTDQPDGYELFNS